MFKISSKASKATASTSVQGNREHGEVDHRSMSRLSTQFERLDTNPRRRAGGSGFSSHRAALPGRGGLAAHERALIGVARWPDQEHGHAMDPAQARYGESFCRAVEHAAGQLADRTLDDFQSLWKFATNWRVAQLPTTDLAVTSAFAQPRRATVGRGALTPITGRYAFLAQRIKEAPGAGVRTPFLGRHDVEMVELRTSGNLGGRNIALTSMRLPYKAGSGLTELLDEGPLLRPLIDHTSAKSLPHILSAVEDMRSELASLGPHEQLSKLAEIHWWLSHAMPDERGSAAKSELCVRALAASHGITLPPFRRGVIPDLEAFVTPLAQYRDQYHTMFERPPTT